MMQNASGLSLSTITVETTARLHMGFIDMHGGLGRKFGSIGLSLDQPLTNISFSQHPSFIGEGAIAGRAVQHAQGFSIGMALSDGARIVVHQHIPEHAGLGSGTQLALAVGAGLNALYDLNFSAHDIAVLSGRGARSGIGVGAFEQGGFLVDGGHADHTLLPPILSRIHFPDHWRILLILDENYQGVHGEQELTAFRTLPEFPAEQAAHIARLVLMGVLPALAEQIFAPFGQAITEIQSLVGRYFAPAQGGAIYTSPAVAKTMQWLQAEGVSCVGQSSWGPTGFAVIDNDVDAEILLQSARRYFPQLQFLCCRARNHGSTIRQERRSPDKSDQALA